MKNAKEKVTRPFCAQCQRPVDWFWVSIDELHGGYEVTACCHGDLQIKQIPLEASAMEITCFTYVR